MSDRDPYAVLGVPRTADDDTIRRAYHDLARKYHPDKYADTDLAELANEKMQEINAAYDAIKSAREAGTDVPYANPGGTSYASSGTGTDPGDESSDERYTLIRSLINSDRLYEAEKILASIDADSRGGEWHFLTGCIKFRNGNVFDAARYFDIAVSLAPYNEEYRNARDKLRSADGSARSSSGTMNVGEPDTCCCCTDDFCIRCCTFRICCGPFCC